MYKANLLAKVRSGKRVSVDSWISSELNGFSNDDMLMVDLPGGGESLYFHSVDGLPKPMGYDDPLDTP